MLFSVIKQYSCITTVNFLKWLLIWRKTNMFHRLKKKKKKGKKEFEGAPLKTKINGRHPLSQNPGSAPAFSFNLLVPLYTSAMQWMHFQSKKLQKFLFLTCMYFYSFYGNVACILRYTHKSCEKGDVPLNGTVLVC